MAIEKWMRISRMNREWHIKSVDIDTILIDDNRLFFDRTGLSGRVVCEVMDLTKLNDNETFDLILSVDVMEHIQDDLQGLRELYRVLKPGGHFMLADQVLAGELPKETKARVENWAR